jgi:hypothetical protein
MAQGRDTRLARVAARALELFEAVRELDRDVRGQRPLKERSLLRSFSRQFFSLISDETRELGEDDILEQEEVLDDNDILDSEEVVDDNDILNPPPVS